MLDVNWRPFANVADFKDRVEAVVKVWRRTCEALDLVKRGSTVSLLALTFAQGGGAAAETAPRSGRYGSLVLAVRGSSVSGVFADVRGGINGMPSFSCIFLLRGTLSGPARRSRLGTQARLSASPAPSPSRRRGPS